MNTRHFTVLSHLATWGVLFLLPMTFRKLEYPALLIPPSLVVFMFYLNYLWLTPHYYMKGRKMVCWLANFVLVVGFTVAVHFLIGVDRAFSFNLAVAVIIAVTMRMARHWQQSEEARLAAEAARADAELSILRYEMNPHFLLNTLNNIYALTAFDPRRAQEAIQQLSAMLRHILYDNTEQEVQIDAEVAFLENYIQLMKIRLSGQVDIRFDATQVTKHVKIAPLILIPLVENAFKHGISLTRPSFIHITLAANEKRIDFQIENSCHPKSASDHSGYGIGLNHVSKRLQLAYPDQYTWHYGTSEDGNSYISHIIITPTKSTN